MSDLKLVIFDVDGTLVDSQGDILASMQAAFEDAGIAAPVREQVLGIVGLSLPNAMASLAPQVDAATQARMVAVYKDSYAALRAAGGAASSPLYPGMRDLLNRLHAHDSLLLGVATGKSRRGLNALFESLDLGPYFVTAQVSDDHPSKPSPAMLFAALSEAGVDASDAVMIGDTEFDIQMAQAAGMASIGVSWGYHPRAALAGASRIVDDSVALEAAVTEILGVGRE